MADEPVIIEATAGPYAGKRLSVTAAEAKKAISEGWATDPFAAAEEAKETKELTDEERFKVLEAATKGAARLRGEEEAEKPAKETKAMEADKPTEDYQTRGSKAKYP